MAEFDNLGLKSLVFSMAFFLRARRSHKYTKLCYQRISHAENPNFNVGFEQKKPRCARLGTSRKNGAKIFKNGIDKKQDECYNCATRENETRCFVKEKRCIKNAFHE